MFVEQIKKNRKAAFLILVERKKQNIDTVTVNENEYSYITKRGVIKKYKGFDSFGGYRRSDLYPQTPERVNGFYFVAVK